MAQLVEQRIRNAWVAGSSPARGSFQHYLCGISTSVVHGLPKPARRVRLPYPALMLIINHLHHFSPLKYTQKIIIFTHKIGTKSRIMYDNMDSFVSNM